MGKDNSLPKSIKLLPAGETRRRAKVEWRSAIFERDGWCCAWCRVPLAYDTSTLDHLIPQSQGGGNDEENLITSCKPCNNKRGSRRVEDFRLGIGRHDAGDMPAGTRFILVAV